MTHPVFPFRRALAAALTLASSLAATAMASTAIERQYETQAAIPPHKNLPQGGKLVGVHFVHSKAGIGAADWSMSKRLHRDFGPTVAGCAKARRQLGQPANPPAELPDQELHTDFYTYYAANRAITYQREYQIRMEQDCSVVETVRFTAELHSSKGWCKIDLDRKTASGACDATGHANAMPNPPPPDDAQMDANIAAMEADPRMRQSAAALRAMRSTLSAKAGPKRIIAGYECQMFDWNGFPACISKLGSFIPTSDGYGVMLYGQWAGEPITAVEAKFDLAVASSIFTPYLERGYKITREDAP